MAVQLINVGSIANDGTGDDLREAMIKINQNFEELDLRDDEQTTASNLGTVGEAVFAQKDGYDLQFKRLIPGSNISLESTDNTVVISGEQSVLGIIVGSDQGSKEISGANSLFNILGGTGIETNIVGDNLTITNTGASSLADDPSPALSANLQGNNYNIDGINSISAFSINAVEIDAITYTGNLLGTVHNVDIREIDKYFNSFDFGDINANATGILDFIAKNATINLGTFDSPAPVGIDLGSIL